MRYWLLLLGMLGFSAGAQAATETVAYRCGGAATMIATVQVFDHFRNVSELTLAWVGDASGEYVAMGDGFGFSRRDNPESRPIFLDAALYRGGDAGTISVPGVAKLSCSRAE